MLLPEHESNEEDLRINGHSYTKSERVFKLFGRIKYEETSRSDIPKVSKGK